MEPDPVYLSDARRLKEFSRYFQTKTSLLTEHPIHHDPNDELEWTTPIASTQLSSLTPMQTSTTTTTTPKRMNRQKSTPDNVDYTITALMQCVVNSLDVDKAMVTLLDDRRQFFIGGATRIDKGMACRDWDTEAVWNQDDHVFLNSHICGATVCMRAQGLQERPFYVISDVKCCPIWGCKKLPYSFYAGTPLRTSRGYNVGTLFAVSSKPRPDLSSFERKMMGRMADEVMAHLSAQLKALERNRLMEMNRSLAAFGGAVSAYESTETNTCSLPRRKMGSRTPSAVHYYGELGRVSSHPDPDIPSSVGDLADLNGHSPPITGGAESPESSNLSVTIYQRAAQHLQAGMGFSGVAYLTTDDSRGPLACINAPQLGRQDTPSFLNLSLQDLIQNYPQGHIFYFDREGRSIRSASEERMSHRRSFGYSSLPDNGERQLEETLHKCLPHARQIVIMPVWNLKNDTSSVASIAWRDCWGRLYTDDVDLPFVYSFCMTVIAEVLHQEALVANKQKADFIGSISHEMRTPLHGILASNELLQDTKCDSMQATLVENVHSSAKVLLDVIDHILDFSVLTAEGREGTEKPRLHQHTQPSNRNAGEGSHTSPSMTPHQGLRTVGQQSPGDLALLCEEVIMAVLIGRNYIHLTSYDQVDPSKGDKKGKSSALSRPVVSFHVAWKDWRYIYQPGALRRIIMNLVGNAMKYTEKGFIIVRLEPDFGAEEMTAGADEMVKLTVSDSGRGISKEYIQSRLWTPFAQENQNAQGTGLGLAITKRVVNALGGSIDIETEVGVGTTFTVRLPLKKVGDSREISPGSSEVANLAPSDRFYEYTARQLSGSSVAILVPPVEDLAEPIVKGINHAYTSLVEYLQGWFGFRLVTSPDEHIDLLVIEETVLEHPSARDLEFIKISLPRIIVGVGEIGAGQYRHDNGSAPRIYISKPVAPRKLKLALSRLAEIERAGGDTQADGSLPTQPSPAQTSGAHPRMNPRTRSAEIVTSHQHARADQSGYTEETSLRLSTMLIQADTPAPQSPVPQSPIISPVTGKTPLDQVLANESLTPVLTYLNRTLSESAGQTTPVVETVTAPAEDTNGSPNNPIAKAPFEKQSGNVMPFMDSKRFIPRVLVVDDNSINLRLLTMYLKKHSVPPTHITTATTGLEAVNHFTKVFESANAFDIILMDLSMPVMDGFEATSAIRALEKRMTQHQSQPDDAKDAQNGLTTDSVMLSDTPVDSDLDGSGEYRAEVATASSPLDGSGTVGSTPDSDISTALDSNSISPSSIIFTRPSLIKLPLPAFPPAMIIALTGLVSPKDQKRAFEAGVDGYQTKPFNGDDVKGLLDKWRRTNDSD